MKALFILIAVVAIVGCGKSDSTPRRTRGSSDSEKARLLVRNGILVGTWDVKCESMNNGLIAGKGTMIFNADGTTISHVDLFVNQKCQGKAYSKADLTGTYDATFQDESASKIRRGQLNLTFTETDKAPGGRGTAEVAIKGDTMLAHMTERVLVRDSQETKIDRKDLKNFVLVKQNK